MSDWKEYKLKDCIDVVIDNRGKTPPLSDTGYQLVETNAINGDNKYPDFSKVTKFVNEETYNSWFRKGHPKKGDVLISTVGANIGRVAYSKGSRFCIAQNLIALRTNSLLDSEYLYYFLTSTKIQNNLKALDIGSAQPNLKVPHLLSLNITIPDINHQRKLVDILSKLDDKITLNTQTNQTLEQIAQTIFKSWFIDFDPVRAKAEALADGKSEQEANLAAAEVIGGESAVEMARVFPSGFGEDGGPLGWEYQSVDQLFDVAIGKTPPRKEPEWFSENSDDMQWISIKDMGNSGVFITQSSEYLTNEAVDKFNVKRIPNNTVILSFKLTVGRVAITTKETTTNEAIAHFKLKDNSLLSSEFLYCYLKQFNFNELGSTSSIATAVNSKMVKDIKVIVPNTEVMNIFQEKVDAIFEKIKVATFENENLEKIRDGLLPRLLNGEIEL
ncbi:restriction endonuclease subunit S [Lonepinella sp. BR2474]|uniref:restriction endonuclease subunit S n=1 Tax=Lonepinella sp. BR2474 TaxID=3434548 RepID=UPI003F6E39FD